MNDRGFLRWGVGIAAIIAVAMALFPPWLHTAELPPIQPSARR